MVIARNLGNGPHRPFGSALRGRHAADPFKLPRVGRTRKLQSQGPCPVCGERNWICDCGEAA